MIEYFLNTSKSDDKFLLLYAGKHESTSSHLLHAFLKS